MAFLDHRELKIIKGFGPIPGDTASAEQQPIVVNLMDSNGGISLDGTNGAWSPQIPAVKPLWAENPANDGRTLIAGALNNVTETMRLIITGSDAATVYSNLRRLYDIRQDALDFWQTESQIEPVYLKWWANCGVGPQFALIYTMDIAPEFMNSEMPTIQVTLTIEREFGWRGIPPGANPKYWTLRNYQNQPTSQYSLIDETVYHILNQHIQNEREWNATQSATLTQNYVDISGSLIPGDLPALLCLSIFPYGDVDTVYVGLSTKPTTIPNRSGGAHPVYYTFNAGDSTVDTDTSIANDAGGPRSNSTLVGKRTQTTFATASMTARLHWSPTSKAAISQNMLRGRFMAFLRARVSAAATISLQLRYKPNAGSTGTITTPITITALGTGGAGDTTAWPLSYVGEISIPPAENSAVRTDGLGIDDNATELIYIEAARTSGAGSLYISDLILIPIDESATSILTDNPAGGGSYAWAILDTTGYIAHGKGIDPSARTSSEFTAYSQGQSIMLIPGVNNRLYFLAYKATTNVAPFDDLASQHTKCLINIVPRWAGIRDA